ncbi:MAG: hypothetical protein ACRDSN_20720, partial [Pseudonocardiaceae bacterium]
MDTDGRVRRELVEPIQGSAAAVIEYDDGMPSCSQPLGCPGSEEAASSCHQDQPIIYLGFRLRCPHAAYA